MVNAQCSLPRPPHPLIRLARTGRDYELCFVRFAFDLDLDLVLGPLLVDGDNVGCVTSCPTEGMHAASA